MHGILSWSKWEQLIEALTADSETSWFVYYVQDNPPEEALRGSQLFAALKAIDALLRKEHREPYLGIVYVDDLAAPNLIKIYDPNQLGASCGSSGRLIPPGWIISKWRPQPLAAHPVTPEGRRRWWQDLLLAPIKQK